MFSYLDCIIPLICLPNNNETNDSNDKIIEIIPSSIKMEYSNDNINDCIIVKGKKIEIDNDFIK